MQQEELTTVEAYVAKFIPKCINIVIMSRTVGLQTEQNVQEDKWFEFTVPQVTETMSSLEEWADNPYRPLLLKFYLNYETPPVESASGARTKVLLEAWSFQFHSTVNQSTEIISSANDLTALYKKMVVLTRALYSYLKLLPADKLYQKLKNEEESSFDIEFVLLEDTGIQEDEPTEEVKELITLQLPNGIVHISVRFSAFTGLINSLCKFEGDSGVSQDWVMFVKKPVAVQKLPPAQNQVIAHFKNSFQFMKSAMNSFLINQQNVSPPTLSDSKESETPLDEDVMEFLKELQEARPLDCRLAENVNLTLEMRNALIDKYR